MRNEQKTTITTPIPSSTPVSSVINVLHNHEFIIKLSPIEDHRLVSGSPNDQATYSVTDRKPIVGKTTFEYTITNQSDGIDTKVIANPPPGKLIIAARWRIVQEGGQNVIKEDVTIEGSRMMTGTVKGTVDKNHKEWHQKIIEKAASQ